MNQKNQSKKLWQADNKTIKNSNLHHYMKWLEKNKNLSFKNYDDLWQWSVDQIEEFWSTQLEYHKVIQHNKFSSIIRGEKVNLAFTKYHWFENSTINYAEHIFRNKPRVKNPNQPAIISIQENEEKTTVVSWVELEKETLKVVNFLKENGIKKNDRVVAIITNEIPSVLIYLACVSLGAIYSSCSPDFGINTVVDRFQVIKPKLLFANLSHSYHGKHFNHENKIIDLSKSLPSLKKIVLIGSGEEEESFEKKVSLAATLKNTSSYEFWSKIKGVADNSRLEFSPLPFNHPMVILFSSGTTGPPKAITHSQGGLLLEHLKYLSFHNDLQINELFFWYTSTGWMMWNFLVAALLLGSTIVLYEGSPIFPKAEILFEWAKKLSINHFGCSASYLAYLKKTYNEKKSAKKKFYLPSLKKLRSIGSTGSPLDDESFDWVYQNVRKELWLFSMSGGSDVCTAFVGGCPLEPIYRGEIQKRTLGSKVEIFSEQGNSIKDEVGELVITRPMPSMPIYLLGDQDYEKYSGSYFSRFPEVWQHGDLAKITPRGGIIIYGRSDSTLNRAGIRIGTGEIYRATGKIDFIEDSLIIDLKLDKTSSQLILFVVLKKGFDLNDKVIKAIKENIKNLASPRHIPDRVIAIPDIPYTLSGKKVEVPIKKILEGQPVNQVINPGSLKNPESLQFFSKLKFAKI